MKEYDFFLRSMTEQICFLKKRKIDMFSDCELQYQHVSSRDWMFLSCKVLLVYFAHSNVSNWPVLMLFAVIFVQGREFCSFVASRNISDGFCNATNTQRAKKLGSDNFIDKLHYPLGCFYLSSMISFYTINQFCRINSSCCLCGKWKRFKFFMCLQLLCLLLQDVNTD